MKNSVAVSAGTRYEMSGAVLQRSETSAVQRLEKKVLEA